MKSLSVSVIKSTTKTNLNHNNRNLTKNELRSNKHIDTSRSHENVYLVNQNLQDLYHAEFDKALSQYNSKQTRNDRKIANYYDHILKSKKTAIQQEMIFQIGTAEDFINGFDKHTASKILEECFYDFETRNPRLKIFNAVIHNDESTPHMHINFVPIADGYKRGLEKQVAFDKAIMQQDPTLNKERPFEDWRAQQVQAIEKVMEKFDLRRDLVGTNKIADVNHFKAIKQSETRLKELNKNVKETENRIRHLKTRERELEEKTSRSQDLALKTLKSHENSLKTTILHKDIIQLKKNDYEKIRNLFLEYAESNINLSIDNQLKDKKIDSLVKSNEMFGQEITYYKKQKEGYEYKFSYLDSAYDFFKPYLASNHDRIQKFIDYLPVRDNPKSFLKAFVTSALHEKDLDRSLDISIEAFHTSYLEVIETYGFSNTQKDYELIKELRSEKDYSQSKSYEK